MAILSQSGIVLASQKIGEGDALLHIFSKDYGKLAFIVKGGYRSRTRSGWLLGGNEIFFHYYEYQAKDKRIIRDAEIRFSPLAYSLKQENLSALLQFLGDVRLSSQENEQNPLVYQLVLGFIREVTVLSGEQSNQLLLFARWRLLKYLGHLSWPLHCSLCGNPVGAVEAFYVNHWSSLGCVHCASKWNSSQVVKIEQYDLLFLRDSLSMKWSDAIMSNQKLHPLSPGFLVARELLGAIS